VVQWNCPALVGDSEYAPTACLYHPHENHLNVVQWNCPALVGDSEYAPTACLYHPHENHLNVVQWNCPALVGDSEYAPTACLYHPHENHLNVVQWNCPALVVRLRRVSHRGVSERIQHPVPQLEVARRLRPPVEVHPSLCRRLLIAHISSREVNSRTACTN
jgi:hypothetical protein